MNDGSDFMEIFLQEADEQLQKLDEGILALEKSDDPEIVNEVFRAAHTLKGSSASMGFEEIANLSHAMESLLDEVRSGIQSVGDGVIDALLNAVDALRALIQHTHAGEPYEPTDEALKAVMRACSGPEAITRLGCVRIEVKIADDCAMPSARGFMVFRALSGKGELLSSEPDRGSMNEIQPGDTLCIDFRPSVSRDALVSALEGICEIQATVTGEEIKAPAHHHAEAECPHVSQAGEKPTVRVNVDRLDTLVSLVGELVLDRTRIERIEEALSLRYGHDSLIGNLEEEISRLDRTIAELQEQVMKIRMLPVAQVFSRFPRLVRDIARKEGRKVDLVLMGQETELDRSVLEGIVDPLTHLVRNAVSHGIESPEARKAAGKPEIGMITLSARQVENQIVIETSDDGCGISVEDIRAAAIARGLISKEAAAKLSDRECMQLIFTPGLSTASEITDVSGRGVGLDVVKSNIERLSGDIEIDTEPGVGTRISLRLPLTLAILRALIASVRGRLFAIPHTSVIKTSRRQAAEVRTIEGRPVLSSRGSTLPLVSLSSLYGMDPSEPEEEPMIVVVSAGGEYIGLTADEVIGEQEIVVKPLGGHLGRVNGISAATLLGDGRIALIVDVSGLQSMMPVAAAA